MSCGGGRGPSGSATAFVHVRNVTLFVRNLHNLIIFLVLSNFQAVLAFGNSRWLIQNNNYPFNNYCSYLDSHLKIVIRPSLDDNALQLSLQTELAHSGTSIILCDNVTSVSRIIIKESFMKLSVL